MAELRFGGGLNELDDELIDPSECTEGENFKLDKTSGAFRPRDPLDYKGTATNEGSINGIMQLIARDGTETTLIQSGDTVYEWDGSTFTSEGSVAATSKLRDTYWSLDDVLIITDIEKDTVVKYWDGSTFGTQTTGLSGDLYAKYGIVHQNRVWLFNVKEDSTDYPHMILVSAFEDAEDYDTATRAQSGAISANDAFFMLAPDLKPINGVAKFYDTLIISTMDGRLFRIDGDDATNYEINEFYSGSAATGVETMVNIGNDVAFMRRGGNIESLRSTESYGDVSADDISRMIPDTTDGLTDAIAVYDQVRQYVHWFTGDKVIVLDKDIWLSSQLSPWSVYTTNLPHNFATNAVKYLKEPGTDRYTVYFGDDSGNIFDLNGVLEGDSDEEDDPDPYNIRTFRKSRLFDEFDNINDLIYGRIVYRRKGECTLQMSFKWTDEYSDTISSLNLKGPIVSGGTNFYGSSSSPVYYSGAFYYGAGGVEEERVSTMGFSPVGKGDSFFLTMSINTTVSFLINKIKT